MPEEYTTLPFLKELEAQEGDATSITLPKLFKAFFSTVPAARPAPQATAVSHSSGSRTAAQDDDQQPNYATKPTQRQLKQSQDRHTRPLRLSAIAPSLALSTAISTRADLATPRQMPLPRRELYYNGSDNQSLTSSPTVPDLAQSQSFYPNFSSIPGFPLSKDVLYDDAQSVSSFGGGSKGAESQFTSIASSMFRRLRGEGISREYWMDDASATACFDCESAFTALRRKHHCRLCGQIFCSKCAFNIIPGRRFGHRDYIRVCNLCLAIIKEEKSSSNQLYESMNAHSNSRSTSAAPARPIISGPLETQVKVPQSEFAAATLFPRAEFPPAYYESDEEDFDTPETPLHEEFDFDAEQKGWAIEHALQALEANDPSNHAYAPFRKPRPPRETDDDGDMQSAELLETSENAEMQAIAGHEEETPGLGITVDKEPSPPLTDSDPVTRAITPDQRAPATSLQSPLALDVDWSKRPDTPPSAGFPRPTPRRRSRVSSRTTDLPGNNTSEESPSSDSHLLQRVLQRGRKESTSGDAEIGAVSFNFLRKMLAQCLANAGFSSSSAWETQLLTLLVRCSKYLRCDPRQAGDSMDIRNYIKIKKLPGGRPSDSEYVDGVVFTKTLLHKKMTRLKHNPRIMLLSIPLEYQRPNTEAFLSIDTILKQEKEYLRNLVHRVLASHPHIVLVEKNVSGLALDLLREANVAVARNVKRSVLQAVSRVCQVDIISSLDRLAREPKLARCSTFSVQTYEHPAIPGRRKTFLRLDGCTRELGATLILRGGSIQELAKLKQITRFVLLVAFNLRHESFLFHDEHAFLVKPPSFTYQLPDNVMLPPVSGVEPQDEKVRERLEVSRNLQDAIRPYLTTILSISPFSIFPPPHSILEAQLEDCLLHSLLAERDHCNLEASNLESTFSLRTISNKSPSWRSSSTNSTPQPTPLSGTTTPVSEDRLIASRSSAAATPTTEKSESYAMAALTLPPISPTLLSRESQIQSAEDRHADLMAAFETYCARLTKPIQPQPSILVLYSLVNSATLRTCIAPELRNMTYYGEGDQTLGQFLEDYVAEAQHACNIAGCQHASLLHYKVFVHGTERVTCILEQFPCPVPGGQDRIYMWSYCKICEMPAKHTVMNEQTWSYSFAKYLELSFYPSQLGCRTISPHCEHNPHRDHVRYFALRNLAVRIYSDHVVVNDVAQPPLKLKIRYDVQYRLRTEEMKRILIRSRSYWSSVSTRLSTFNYDLIAPENHEEARATIEGMAVHAQTDSQQIEQLLKETYQKAKWSSGVALNVVLRLLQEKVVEWDSDFTAFEQKFVPSEKDVRRLTGNQLKKLFDTGASALSSLPTSPEVRPTRPSILNFSETSTPLDSLDSIPPSPLDHPAALSKDNLASLDSRLMDLPGPVGSRNSLLADATNADSLSESSIRRSPPDRSGDESDSTICADPPILGPLERPLPSSSSASEDERPVEHHESKLPRRSTLIKRISGKPIESNAASPKIAELVKRFNSPEVAENDLPSTPKAAVREDVSSAAESSPSARATRQPVRRYRSDLVRSSTMVKGSSKPDSGTTSPGLMSQSRPFRRSIKSRNSDKAAANCVPPGDGTPSDGVTRSSSLDSIKPLANEKPAPLRRREFPRFAGPSTSIHSPRSLLQRRSASAAMATASGDAVQPGRVNTIARHFDRISREAERERQKRLQMLRTKRARPVIASKPTLEVYTNTKEALKEDSDDNDEHSEGADDEFEDERAEPTANEIKDEDNRSLRTGSPKVVSVARLPLSSVKRQDQDSSESTKDGTSPDICDGGPTLGQTEPTPSVPPSPMLPSFGFPLSGGFSTTASRHVSNSQFSESELSSSGTDNKSSLIKTISNLWSYRGCEFGPLEYPLKPTEHLFSNNPIIVREDEPSSIIAFALASRAYRDKMQELEAATSSNGLRMDRSEPFMASEDMGHTTDRGSHWGLIDFGEGGATDIEDALKKPPTTQHIKMQFEEASCTFSAKVFFAEQFETLRRKCGVEDAFIESMARCVKWDASGGKSGSAFLKTTDDRFVVKEISRMEMDAFLHFAPAYFDYMSRAFYHGLPTLLAKILGFFRIGFTANGKSTRMDVLVMENLFYERAITKIFDLKGSKRNRHVITTGRRGEVLLDENLTEMAYKSPLFIREQSKRLLRMSLSNDTLFLERLNVMDYSLVVGVDETTNELVVGIVDFIRTYTWDKKLESWVKGTSRLAPTVVTPKLYKNRLRSASEEYFLLVPDKWTSRTDVQRSLEEQPKEDGHFGADSGAAKASKDKH